MLPILVSALILVLSILLAWLVGPLLGIAGTALTVLRVLLVLLGAVAAAIVLFLHFRDKRRDAATMKRPRYPSSRCGKTTCYRPADRPQVSRLPSAPLRSRRRQLRQNYLRHQIRLRPRTPCRTGLPRSGRHHNPGDQPLVRAFVHLRRGRGRRP